MRRFGRKLDVDALRASCRSSRSSSTACTSTATTCSTTVRRTSVASARATRCRASSCPARRGRRRRRGRRALLRRRARPRARGRRCRRRWTRRTRPGGAARHGSRSSARTRSISWCSPPSGATAAAQGWLSNLHLGARDPDGGFVMLGKTFKGMTDEMLAWQTGQLLDARDRARRARRPRAARAGGRDRLQRRAGEPAATPAAWRSASRGSRAIVRTKPPRRRTRSTSCARSGRRAGNRAWDAQERSAPPRLAPTRFVVRV